MFLQNICLVLWCSFVLVLIGKQIEALDYAKVTEKDLKEAFDVFDLDKDGKIVAEELTFVLEKLEKEHYDNTMAQNMIQKFDLDNDGMINFEEFKVMMQTQVADGSDADSDADRIFKKFDANGDGKISAQEIVQILKAIGKDATIEEINNIIASCDANSDQLIDRKEFDVLVKELFQKDEELVIKKLDII